MKNQKPITNNFDQWNEVKKDTDKVKRHIGIKPREIYWAKIGYNVGDEQYGKGKEFVRPILIIRALTKDLFIGVPTSTTIRENKDYFQTIHYKDDLNRNIKSSCMLLQIKTFSKKRLLNKIGKVKQDEFKKIVEKIKVMIDPT